MARSARYLQIADDLRRRIESGEFAADTPLPTETGLQQEYQASRNTIREAIKLLVQQHLLETKAGRGTFITEEIVPFVTTLSTDPRDRPRRRRRSGDLPGARPRTGPRGRGASTPEVQVLNAPSRSPSGCRSSATTLVVSRQQERSSTASSGRSQTSYYPQKWVALGAAACLTPPTSPMAR